MRGEYSLADIAAATGNSNGNGNGMNDAFNNPLWALIFLAFLGNRGGLGFDNGGGNSGCSSSPQIIYGGFGTPDIYNKLDGITYGISDATFSLNNTMTNGFANVQSTLCQGFAGVNNAITVNGYETRGAITDLGYRLQDCCCQTQRAIDKCCCDQLRATDGINFNLSQLGCGLNNTINNATRDILESNNNNTRAILDFLTKDKIDTLQAENQTLRFQASQTAQNAFITANQQAQTAELIRRLGADCPQPAYLVNGPTPISFPTNGCGQVQFSNNNCGCGCGNY